MIATERTTICGYICAVIVCGMMLCEDGDVAIATSGAIATGLSGLTGYAAGRYRKLRTAN